MAADDDGDSVLSFASDHGSISAHDQGGFGQSNHVTNHHSFSFEPHPLKPGQHVTLPPMMTMPELHNANSQMAGAPYQQPQTFLPSSYTTPSVAIHQPATHPKRRPSSSQKKKQKKQLTKDIPEIAARPDSDENKFRQARQYHQQSRGKVVPLAENNQCNNIMAPSTRNGSRSISDSGSAEAQGTDKQPGKPLLLDGKPFHMPDTMKGLKKKLREVIQRHEAMRAKLAPLQNSFNKLKEEHLQLQESVGKTAKNEEVLKKIKDTYAEYFWRNVKFLQDDEEENSLLTAIYNKMYPEDERKTLGESHKEIWLNTYHDQASASVNSHRSYVQGRLKCAFLNFFEEKEHMPSMEQILKCALRTIDLKDPKNAEVMDFYCKDLLSTYLPA